MTPEEVNEQTAENPLYANRPQCVPGTMLYRFRKLFGEIELGGQPCTFIISKEESERIEFSYEFMGSESPCVVIGLDYAATENEPFILVDGVYHLPQDYVMPPTDNQNHAWDTSTETNNNDAASLRDQIVYLSLAVEHFKATIIPYLRVISENYDPKPYPAEWD